MDSESSTSPNRTPPPSESAPATTSASSDSPTEPSDSNPSDPSSRPLTLINIGLDALHTADGENHRFDLDPTALGELAASLKADGLINPIRVRRRGDDYELVAGFRRVAAARSLGWRHISATLAAGDGADDESQRLAENLFRTDLTPVEQADAIKVYQARHGLTIDAMAARFSRTPAWIESRLAIAEYDERILRELHLGNISIGVADELAQIRSPDQMSALLDAAVHNGCTRRQAQLWRSSANATIDDPTGRAVAAPIMQDAGPPPTVHALCFSCENERNVTGMSYVKICGECMAAIRDGKARDPQGPSDTP